jgi:hypothetical protein
MESTVKLGKHYSIKKSEINHFNSLIKPKNPEQLFKKQAIDKGYKVFKTGWPDYLIQRNGTIAFIEIKKDKNDKLKSNQYELMRILHEYGLACFIWRPDTGFSKFKVR